MFEPVTSDDAKLPDKMTSSNFPLSNSDFSVVATAFAVERQVLTPELSQLFANPLRWGHDDKQKIAAGLLLCLSSTIGQTISDVKIERLERLPPTGRDRGLIDFKLICRLRDLSQVHLGICVLPFADREVVNEVTNLFAQVIICRYWRSFYPAQVSRSPDDSDHSLSISAQAAASNRQRQDLYLFTPIKTIN
jgi:hypothetical protein